MPLMTVSPRLELADFPDPTQAENHSDILMSNLPESHIEQAIVVPSYKAATTLPSVLPRIPDAFWERGRVLLVNDGSPDNTGEVADQLSQSWKGVEVIHHQQNQGYGGAQKTGLHRAIALGAKGVAVVHADGQYAPEIVMDLLQPIMRDEAMIVQGSRMLGSGALKGGMPLHRYLANRGLTSLENLAFGTRMAEFHSGYMLYHRKLLESVPFDRLQNNYNFDAEMIIMAHLRGHRCLEMGIPTRYDDEVSSLKPIPYGINVLKMIGRYLRGDYRRILREFDGTQRAKATQ